MLTSWRKMLRLVGAFALLASSLTGCARSHTYVLVHGAFSDSNAWQKVTPLLEKEGHKVVTLDLPAHGKDTTPVEQASLQGYTDRVLQAVDAQQKPVILVGHSMGGTVISQVAEQRPDEDGKTLTLKLEALQNAFCQDCFAADAQAISANAPRPEPVAPQGTPVTVTEANLP